MKLTAYYLEERSYSVEVVVAGAQAGRGPPRDTFGSCLCAVRDKEEQVQARGRRDA